MKNRLSFALLALLTLVGCDRNRNQPNKASNAVPEKIESTSSTCPIEFSKHKLCASLVWSPMATTTEFGKFTLRFWNKNKGTANGPFVNPPGAVSVVLKMPFMACPAERVNIKQKETGVFTADEVMFNMPDEWDIRIQLLLDNDIAEQAILRVKV